MVVLNVSNLSSTSEEFDIAEMLVFQLIKMISFGFLILGVLFAFCDGEIFFFLNVQKFKNSFLF